MTSEDAPSAPASFKATRAPANHLIAVLQETLKERQPTKPQPESTKRKIVNVALSHCVLSAAEGNEEEGNQLVCREDKRLREHEPENLSVFCAENKPTEEQRFGVAAMEDGKTELAKDACENGPLRLKTHLGLGTAELKLPR